MRVTSWCFAGVVCLSAALGSTHGDPEPARSGSAATAEPPREVRVVARLRTPELGIPSFWESLTTFYFTDDEPRRLPNHNVRLPMKLESEAELRVQVDEWAFLAEIAGRDTGERVPLPSDPRLLLHVDAERGTVTIENAQYLGPQSAIDSLRRIWLGCACLSRKEGVGLDHPRFQFHCVTSDSADPRATPRRLGPGFLTVSPDGSSRFAPEGELDSGQGLTAGDLVLAREEDGDWWLWFELP